MSTFEHNGVQSILNEEKPPWNKIEPSIFFDEANYGPLHMLYCMIHKFNNWFPTLIFPLYFIQNSSKFQLE